jgi:hypothetical protein
MFTKFNYVFEVDRISYDVALNFFIFIGEQKLNVLEIPSGLLTWFRRAVERKVMMQFNMLLSVVKRYQNWLLRSLWCDHQAKY